MLSPTVLVVTKRPAELCGTQALLYGAGFDMVTATNITAARCVMAAMQVVAVVVCKHSWPEGERDALVAELNTLQGQLAVSRCPGCTGCDEAAGKPGTLDDDAPLIRLIASARRMR